MHLSPQQLHTIAVQRLTNRVLLAHKNLTLQPHQRSGGGGGYAVLPGAGLGDHPGFAQALGQQALTQYIVDFVGAGVVQVLAL